MNDSKQAALTFAKEHTLGTLATISADGMPRARTLYYIPNDDLEIFFFTLAGTRKVEDINANHKAAFVVSDEMHPKTLQLEGTLTELPETTLADPQMQGLLNILRARGDHFAPVTHLDANTILFYKLTPSWIRFGDFTERDGTDEVFSVIA